MAAKTAISEDGISHAYRAMTLANDLTKELLLVRDELGYIPSDLARKRRIVRFLNEHEDMKELLNRLTLAEKENVNG